MVDLVDDELLVEHLAGDALSHESCLQLYRERCPDLVAHGLLVQQTQSATVQETNGADMTATYTLCTVGKDVNRAGRIVRITPNQNGQGLILDAYQQAPVVLFNHGFGGVNLPVGLSETPDGKSTLKAQKSKLSGTCYFSQLPHAAPIFAAVETGLLRMASIGFNVQKAMRFSVKQEETNPGVMSWAYSDGIDVVEAELIEWSITDIGIDRGALRQCLERGTVGGEKIPRWLAQSWAAQAEPRRAWSPGMIFVQQANTLEMLEQFQATIKTQSEALHDLQTRVAQVTAPSERSVPAVPVPAAQQAATPPEPLISTDQLVQAFRQQAVEEPSLDLQQIGAQFQSLMAGVVSEAVKPLIEEQARLAQQVQLMSGRLD